VITLIDTPGAYPGIDSEERGISEAIAQNLAVMSRLRTPIICVVIGEGSSGGAIGIGVGDHLAMLQYATYFVISPEGCANIIWKTSEKAPEAAEAMGVTSGVLQELGIVDATIPEPLGGAHRDVDAMATRVREHLVELQRREAAGRSIITEGRDQGTVVFPSAECKIFLTATPTERARRRLLELRSRGETAEFGDVLQQIRDRDARDESRPVGRLMKAPDAVEVVTDGMSLERVVDTLEQLVRGKPGAP